MPSLPIYLEFWTSLSLKSNLYRHSSQAKSIYLDSQAEGLTDKSLSN